MPTYITLLKYTQQGIGNIKRSPARLDAAKRVFKQAGRTSLSSTSYWANTTR